LRGWASSNVYRVCVADAAGCRSCWKFRVIIRARLLLTGRKRVVKERSISKRGREECGMRPLCTTRASIIHIFLWTTIYMCSCYKIIILGNGDGPVACSSQSSQVVIKSHTHTHTRPSILLCQQRRDYIMK
jgi:hypothetical protein